MEFDLKQTLLALLFSSSEPLSTKDVQAVITRYHEQAEADLEEEAEDSGAGSVSDSDGQGLMKDLLNQVPSLLTTTQIRDAMDAIQSDLGEQSSVFRIDEGVAGYRLSIAPKYADWVRLLRDEPRPQKLRVAAMETLAIVAYRQPVTRAEIEAIRGVSADSALSKLLEKELVYIVGRAELPGRPLQYGTTEAFLDYCGIRNLEELPASDVLTSNQISEWIRNATMPEEEIGDEDVGLASEEELIAESEETESEDDEPHLNEEETEADARPE